MPKLEVEGQVIQEEMRFKYIVLEVAGYCDVEEEVRQQITKAGSLNNTIWCNKNMRIESKTRTDTTMIRPIMTYCAVKQQGRGQGQQK